MLPFTAAPCMKNESVEQNPNAKGRSSRLPWILVLLLSVLLVAAGLRIYYLMQVQQAAITTLTTVEQSVLDAKLARLREAAVGAAPVEEEAPGEKAVGQDAVAAPEIYQEDPDRRYLRFTERELNAVIARDPALAGRAAVRLSPGQVSSSFLVDVPEEMPLVGGRRVRVQAGLHLVTEGDRVRARLLGVSVAGVPLPNAWLGGLKGADLLEDSGLGGFGAGIETVEVGEGWVALRLAP
jgi:hypothetical protein